MVASRRSRGNSVTIELTGPLSQFYRKASVKSFGRSVTDALRYADKSCPALSDKILDELDRPRPHVLIFLNDTKVNRAAAAGARLRKGDIIRVFNAISGG